MRTKTGVILNGLKPQMRKVLINASQIWQEYGHELVVTSTTEGQHIPSSYHPFGYAIDLRTRYFDKRKISTIADQLSHRLGTAYYTVIIEKDHIHVQYNALNLGES